MNRIVTVSMTLLSSVLPPSWAPADDVDDLIKKLKPPPRFAEHSPDFSVHREEFTYEYSAGPVTMSLYIIKDRDRHVAFIPQRSGTIHLLDFNPNTAPIQLHMPSERLRLETSVGTKLRTDAFIPTEVGQTDASYRFTKSGGGLTLIRHYEGTSTFDKWTHRSETPLTIDTTNTFVFKCDPILGYVVGGNFDTKVNPAPKTFEYFSAATTDICNVWAGEDACSRVAITPTYRGGFEGYYLNFPATDLSDNDRDRFRCRDGGFASFLNEKTGWSPTTTLEGCEARFVVCNAHADLDFVTEWPGDSNGPAHRIVKTRILALPPEITQHIWDTMDVRFQKTRRVQMRIGVVENFEDQPLPLTTCVRGLTSTGGGPPVTQESARSGTTSVIIQGKFWPNLPQVPLQPNTQYRLEAWFKVVPWTPDELKEAEKKENARIEKLRQRGEEVPDFKGLGPPEAYITGNLYVSSPHLNVWAVEQRTNSAIPGGPEWQKVCLEFKAPKWGPFINIVFIANACTAYMDDFSLKALRQEEGSRRQ